MCLGRVVEQHRRGRGLARRVVEAAPAKAQTLGPEFALRFCRDDRAGLYARLGFAEVGGVVRVEQTGGYRTIPSGDVARAARRPPVAGGRAHRSRPAVLSETS